MKPASSAHVITAASISGPVHQPLVGPPASDADPVGEKGVRHLRGRRRAHDMSRSARRPFRRDQRTTIINGLLVFVLIVVILQLWLLTATMNAWLGGDA